jgi:hypothetical protein
MRFLFWNSLRCFIMVVAMLGFFSGAQATNVTLVSTTASTVNSSNLASNAIDGNVCTRWESQQGVDPQWIYVDLGSTYSITSVVLIWEAANAKNYTVDVSNSTSGPWTTVWTETNMANCARTDSLSGNSGTGRYVRMNGTARNLTYGYSLFEIRVYGTIVVAPTISTQPVNATVTATKTATFSVTAGGTAPLSFQWRKNGVNIIGATTSSYTTPATTATDNGAVFDVIVSNAAGSVPSNQSTLTVLPWEQAGTNISFNGGNVGIGTGANQPSEKLEVNGRIKCSELKIQDWLFQQKAPDYVFSGAGGYKLPTLEMVEEYIKMNNHLPEVPSASEMQNGGLDMAQFNMVLLKKVEELTLYTIELQKRVQALEGKNETAK